MLPLVGAGLLLVNTYTGVMHYRVLSQKQLKLPMLDPWPKKVLAISEKYECIAVIFKCMKLWVNRKSYTTFVLYHVKKFIQNFQIWHKLLTVICSLQLPSLIMEDFWFCFSSFLLGVQEWAFIKIFLFYFAVSLLSL